MRRSRHWAARMPSSDSARSSQLPCLGVCAIRSARPTASYTTVCSQARQADLGRCVTITLNCAGITREEIPHVSKRSDSKGRSQACA
jgi:hypothetical protein